MIAALDLREVWVGSDNADTAFTYLKVAPVENGERIVTFRATPKDTSKAMTVRPSRPNLQITLDPQETGLLEESLDGVLRMLHHHVERIVIDLWFKYGHLPL